jgi:WhiB family redox-sensing transcriptional regulator
MHDDTDTGWMAEGNCRNHPPATFFPSDGVGVDRARRICNTCPKTEMCLEYALANRIDHGLQCGKAQTAVIDSRYLPSVGRQRDG